MPRKRIDIGETERLLGIQFRETRQAHGVSLHTVALALKMSVNTLRWHELGMRMMRVDDVTRAAVVIGCKPEALMIVKRAKRKSATPATEEA